MYYSLKNLKGYVVGATDGDIGRRMISILAMIFESSDIWWSKPVVGFSIERCSSRPSRSARWMYQGRGSM
jgi:hypothetical protein